MWRDHCSGIWTCWSFITLQKYALCLSQDARDLLQQCEKLDTQVLELQRSPYARATQDDQLKKW